MKSKILGVSLITITCLYGLLAGIIILATILLGGSVLIACVAGIILIALQFLIAPWLTDLSMRWFYRAKFNKEIPDYLKKFIEEECEKHNVKYPRIGIIDDGAPNAFTYGRTKRDARLVLTRGIFDLLTEEEVKAVVGHEMGHIVHMDMLVMTAVQIVPLVMYAVFEMLADNNNDSDDNKAAIVGYIAFVLYIISQYFILWLSRTREYYADEFSVEETGNPNALAEALVKIGFGLSTSAAPKKEKGKKYQDVSKRNALGIFDKNASKAMAISAMDEKGVSKEKIKNAMKWEMWNPWAKWFELNSTHPLISKRINKISEKAESMNKKPYIVFDLEKTQKFAGNFLLEVIISFMPALCVIATAIVCCAYPNYLLRIIGIGLLATVIFSFIKYMRAHRKGYKETTVEDLLGEVNVSHVTSVPAIVEGTIIGRGNPGCIFSEDFVIKDKTGIIFLDYNQPLGIINKIFAIFKSKDYFDKVVNVKGWYRRSPVPYIEIYEYTVDGKTKKVWTYPVTLVMFAIAAVASIVLMII